jgi:histidine triad (HIT) family protein
LRDWGARAIRSHCRGQQWHGPSGGDLPGERERPGGAQGEDTGACGTLNVVAEACIFCRIVRGEVSSERLREDGELIVIRDIAPMAPVHLLIIARQHVGSLNEVNEQHQGLLGEMTVAAVQEASNQGLQSNGYRLVMNCGRDAGQGVEHLHLHLLGGRQLGPIA